MLAVHAEHSERLTRDVWIAYPTSFYDCTNMVTLENRDIFQPLYSRTQTLQRRSLRVQLTYERCNILIRSLFLIKNSYRVNVLVITKPIYLARCPK